MSDTPKPASVAETLRAARALITPRGAWTKGTFARDSRSVVVHARDAVAVRWCALGALERVDGRYEMEAQNVLSRAIGEGIVGFNDAKRTKHKDILAAYDKAIALAEQAS